MPWSWKIPNSDAVMARSAEVSSDTDMHEPPNNSIESSSKEVMEINKTMVINKERNEHFGILSQQIPLPGNDKSVDRLLFAPEIGHRPPSKYQTNILWKIQSLSHKPLHSNNPWPNGRGPCDPIQRKTQDTRGFWRRPKR
ncbi:hypothetical protein AVEN_233523-1 [Araneus ventricosus]|uniref:Uncharacterized protein n=1 Tax=Araneus ventricosus TaxID=182803 RepID=A0A4Y2NC87_ARAVE|nr:hypothetical protein AVEN_233523-1 [Araneus ventricosus]